MKKRGKQTYTLVDCPVISGHASIAGPEEAAGPLGRSFDCTFEDPYFGEKTWEAAESAMQKKVLALSLEKAGLSPSSVDMLFGGDLIAQCTGTTFSLRNEGIPFFGIYGACSTMSEALALAAMAIDGGFADDTAAITSSHFCTAERQFRAPLEYGGQRPPSSQRTATAAGAAVLSREGHGPRVTGFTVGRIVDNGITDANNMGAAMMPAAYDTLSAHFSDLNIRPDYYDLIVTGDLGAVGSAMLAEWFEKDGLSVTDVYSDCGLLIFDRKSQDVHSGGSGCGCSASVLCGHILNGMRRNEWNRVLFAATGALLSAVSAQQGETIPSICYAVSIENEIG